MTDSYFRFLLGLARARQRMMVIACAAVFHCISIVQPCLLAQDNQPKAIPQTRREMLAALEALKSRTARIPLDPSLAAADPNPTPGRLGVVNNGLMRRIYLPKELQMSGTSRGNDPAMELDYAFSTELFWIVSRINNCHYCLGHQESKLLAEGVTEETLAALDSDWQSFSPDQAAAFEFCRKLTLLPHQVEQADFDRLEKFYSPQRILELAFLVARYNSTNRWTDSLGIPQEGHREYASHLESSLQDKPSQLAPSKIETRDFYSSQQDWLKKLDSQADRSPRLPLASLEQTQKVWEVANLEVPLDVADHERLLAVFPMAGGGWIVQLRSARTAGELDQDLRDKIAFVAAMEDRAWYMQSVSRKKLNAAGHDDSDLFAMANRTHANQDSTLDRENACLAFAQKLTSHPQQMTDADISGLLVHFSPQQVAEIVFHVGNAAFLNRLTESAALTPVR